MCAAGCRRGRVAASRSVRVQMGEWLARHQPAGDGVERNAAGAPGEDQVDVGARAPRRQDRAEYLASLVDHVPAAPREVDAVDAASVERLERDVLADVIGGMGLGQELVLA